MAINTSASTNTSKQEATAATTRESPSPPRVIKPASSPNFSVGDKFVWEEVSTEFTARAVAKCIYGDYDTGKTTLALSAPGPIAFFHAYEKVGGLLQYVRRSKDIRVHKFGGPMEGNPDKVQRLAEEEIKLFEAGLDSAYSWARSIVIDQETRLWELYQLSRLGSMVRAERDEKDNKKGQLIYQEINNRWTSMLMKYRVNLEAKDMSNSKRPKTNLVIISRTKDEYKGPSATGRTVRAGQKDTGSFCDVVVRTRRKDEFSVTIEKPWNNNSMRGVELSQDMMRFSEIMSMVTETSSEEWE